MNAPVKATALEPLLHPRDAAQILNVSTSWLAKARMRGDGPPFIRVGRSVRYGGAALLQWVKSRQRLSTSER
jgi:predicted DNA-binding transcriptional regulator AlpA